MPQEHTLILCLCIIGQQPNSNRCSGALDGKHPLILFDKFLNSHPNIFLAIKYCVFFTLQVPKILPPTNFSIQKPPRGNKATIASSKNLATHLDTTHIHRVFSQCACPNQYNTSSALLMIYLKTASLVLTGKLR